MTDSSARAFARARRFVLGGSVAALAVSLVSAPAHAAPSDIAAPQQGLLDIGQMERSAQFGIANDLIERDSSYRLTAASPTAQVSVAPTGAELTPQIVIANCQNQACTATNTTVTDRDPTNVTGIGQMIVDEQTGFIGLCTGTLINPRTVIFAAHCVNERAAGAYGQDSGGQPIGFGFSNNNNQAGNSAFGGWLGNYATNTARFMYDVNYVAYNPLSTEPDAALFLYGDVATASLDTPAANVPTWALLFSVLPTPTITAAGTGYHVTIEGYGNNGTASTGSTGGIDYRRRIAENTLGALASLGDFEQFLFGPTGTSDATNPQNLYWLDFDDVRRGTAAADRRDFNAFRDNALPNEGITASGDSGGPLILDRTFAKAVVIGVLSGGYDRFFNGQPANGLGTASFYQPLYLYWDWIAANNPYHYVSSLAGNGSWTDPTHWVTNLDPAYQVIVNGQLVNGIPTAPGAGNTDQPGFGQICAQGPSSAVGNVAISDCYDVATGREIVENKPIGTAGDGNGPATVSVDTLAGGDGAETAHAVNDRGYARMAADEGETPVGTATSQSASAAAAAAALPAATLANGLPGASNFVPNNYDGDRIARTAPRYFDVTLSATGTTTLGSAVVIDRFTMAGAGAMLDIQTAGSLTSLISVTQGTGTMQVNGSLTTPGDYMMLTGGLNGTGTITTPFFTSIAGTISPGTTGAAGTIGALTFRGNVILASGTTYLVDLGLGGLSDRIVVNTNGTGTGQANVGGTVLFSRAAGALVRAGDRFTIVTSQGALTGTFSAGSSLSAILTPSFVYLPNAVDVVFQAGLYANVVDRTSAVQSAYAQLLDSNRAANYGALSGLYGPLDLESAGNIRAFFEASAPRDETTRGNIAVGASGVIDRFFRLHVQQIDAGHPTGQLAMTGQPIQFAQASATMGASAAVQSDVGPGETADTGVALAENMSGYVVGGYLDGDSLPMPAAGSAGRDQYNGWYVAGGLERAVGDHATVGFGLSYADVDGHTGGAPQQAAARLAQGTLYGVVQSSSGVRLDGRASLGVLSTESRRTVSLSGTAYNLRLDDHSLMFSSEVGVGYNVTAGHGFSVVPRASLRYETIGFDRVSERGGPMALLIDRDNYKSLESRLGLSVTGSTGPVRPYLEANYVHDFADQPTSFGATFVGGTGFVPFALSSNDDDWGEIGGGLAIQTGNVELAVEADTTVLRDDVRNQSYRGRISFRF